MLSHTIMQMCIYSIKIMIMTHKMNRYYSIKKKSHHISEYIINSISKSHQRFVVQIFMQWMIQK